MIKMIATDLDGTLLRSDKTISPYTKDVLQQCRARGVKLVFATARPCHNALELTEGIAVDGMVATNGAFVYAGETLLHEHAMPVEISRALLAELAAYSGATHLSARKRDGCYKTHPAHKTDILYDFTQPLNDTIAHMSFRTKDAAFAESLISAYPQLEIHRVTGELLYDIGPQGCTKAAGLTVLSEHFGISPAEIAAFGDDHNDVDMLAYAGTGVAMANAIDEAKAAANCICASNENDGVARWLEEHI